MRRVSVGVGDVNDGTLRFFLTLSNNKYNSPQNVYARGAGMRQMLSRRK